VGGATKVHPTARVAMKILGNPDARHLSEIIAAVGLAQNLAAIRALATEGIQRGHMRQAARQMVLAAGATPEQVARIVEQMITENNIRQDRANEIAAELKSKKG
jgi:hydroxymethylglutaryl-CoA reductase